MVRRRVSFDSFVIFSPFLIPFLHNLCDEGFKELVEVLFTVSGKENFFTIRIEGDNGDARSFPSNNFWI